MISISIAMRLSRPLDKKPSQYEQRHEKGILQHNHARLHATNHAKTYLETHKWEVPLNLSSSPSDYYLFRSTAHGLADKQFRILCKSTNRVLQFLTFTLKSILPSASSASSIVSRFCDWPLFGKFPIE